MIRGGLSQRKQKASWQYFGHSNMRGFTVVETMIFLAVSGALLMSALAAISGRQARAEFTYGVQDFASRVRDITNDVSTGYFAYPEGTTCTAPPAGPPVPVGGGVTPPGSNSGCIFIGRVLHFGTAGVGGANQGYQVFTVVGRRVHTDGRDVTDLTQSFTVPLPNDNSRDIMANGVEVRWVRSGAINYGAVGLFGDFIRYNNESRSLTETESRSVSIVPINGTSIGQDAATVRSRITTNSAGSPLNPADGVQACLQSNGSNLHSIISIGANTRQAGSDIEIRNGPCP